MGVPLHSDDAAEKRCVKCVKSIWEWAGKCLSWLKRKCLQNVILYVDKTIVNSGGIIFDVYRKPDHNSCVCVSIEHITNYIYHVDVTERNMVTKQFVILHKYLYQIC